MIRRRNSLDMRRLLADQRGTAVLLTIGMMVFILAMVGVAVDLGYQFAAIGEVEKSMEAAALAGAGNLGFNDTAFPAARAAAVQYATLNPYHNPGAKVIRLDPNPANAPNGEVVLGVWDNASATFTPSVDGTVVNAVRCRKTTTVPTTFLRVLGIQTLPVSGSSIAIANPPALPPPNTCVFPIGLSSCPFQNNQVFTSGGCGKTIKFITSNGKADSSNTAAWVNMSGSGTPTPPTLNAQIDAAKAGNCNPNPPAVGSEMGTNNGMAANVFQNLKTAFVTEFNQSVAQGTKYTIKDTQGNVVYNGPGWQVYVPVIQTNCTANGTTQAIQGDHQLVGWTRFVMTQAYDTTGQSTGCAVSNPADSATASYCTNPPPELKGGSSRSIFGYYDCGIINSPPTLQPVPRAAIGNRLRLVKMYQ
jgi:Flp pilus assembly protein TadG